jgi:adenylate cyclase
LTAPLTATDLEGSKRSERLAAYGAKSSDVLSGFGTTVVIEIIAGCLVGAAIACVQQLLRARRMLWMARHPAPTFVFADLVGYTALTERRGDDAAAQVAHEFWRAMSALCREHGARQVKLMGDASMIWVPDAAQAVMLAGRAIREVGTRTDLLPVRLGAHTGSAVLRGGDWYGAAVNLAARLAAAAEPNQVLVSGATRAAANSEHEWPCRSRRELALRGVEGPIVAWELTASAGRRRDGIVCDGRIIASLAS